MGIPATACEVDNTMELVTLLILIALAQYIYFTGRTGLTRAKYGISAPKTVGDDTWERIFRVQQNTMEQLVPFVPGMIAFAYLVSPTWALLPGSLFIIGRALYSHQYISKPDSRATGMVITMLSNVVLVVGSMVGVIIKSMN